MGFDINGGVLKKYEGSGGNVVIPDGVTSIGDLVFLDYKITSVEIPASVTSIGKNVFLANKKLTSINVDGNNYHYKSIDGVLFNKDGTLLHTVPLGKALTSYDIPDGVSSIGELAFHCYTSLRSVTIPASVRSIGERAFHGCKSLTSVDIPASVISIGENAFSYCTSLTGVEIPASVTSIGTLAFSDCKGLANIEISTSVTSIGDFAFSGCTGLTSVDIPASVTFIGKGAFYGCKNLKRVSIASPATFIGEEAFDETGCKGAKAGKTTSGACYIATAVYGSYSAPSVMVLRRFRDEVLEQSLPDRLFVRCYYRFSPPVAHRLGKTRRVNRIVRRMLDALVGSLKKKRRW